MIHLIQTAIFFNTHGFTNTTYFTPETLKTMANENNDISFSVLHLNIRILNENLIQIEIFFNTHGFTNTTYFTPETLKTMANGNNDITFSVLHLNIRS